MTGTPWDIFVGAQLICPECKHLTMFHFRDGSTERESKWAWSQMRCDYRGCRCRSKQCLPKNYKKLVYAQKGLVHAK